jgi:hypothetical protein
MVYVDKKLRKNYIKEVQETVENRELHLRDFKYDTNCLVSGTINIPKEHNSDEHIIINIDELPLHKVVMMLKYYMVDNLFIYKSGNYLKITGGPYFKGFIKSSNDNDRWTKLNIKFDRENYKDILISDNGTYETYPAMYSNKLKFYSFNNVVIKLTMMEIMIATLNNGMFKTFKKREFDQFVNNIECGISRFKETGEFSFLKRTNLSMVRIKDSLTNDVDPESIVSFDWAFTLSIAPKNEDHSMDSTEVEVISKRLAKSFSEKISLDKDGFGGYKLISVNFKNYNNMDIYDIISDFSKGYKVDLILFIQMLPEGFEIELDENGKVVKMEANNDETE